MRLSNIGELSLLEDIRDRFRKKRKGLIKGIGDDAAVIAPFKERLLLTSDMMLEGIHFDLSFVTPYQLGYRIVSVNVSDIYAMSGKPEYLLLDLAMKADTDSGFVNDLLKGLRKALDDYDVILAGGDLSASKEGIVISATVVGRCKTPVLRSGARPGDRIYVTGYLGDSACGLEILKRLKRPVPIEDKKRLKREIKQITERLSQIGLSWDEARLLIKRHLFPRVHPYKVRSATAMMDISDGLFMDLMRLCDESRVGARIYLNKLPLSRALKRACSVLDLDPDELATSVGEDYELLFTAPSGDTGINAFCIGEIIKDGRFLVDRMGVERILRSKGYEHWQ